MAEQNFAPYAPAKAVLGVIQKYRDRGLPAPLTPGVLEQVGVPASMAARTLQALRFLGLIDEGGNRLPSFDNLQRAKTDHEVNATVRNEVAEQIMAGAKPDGRYLYIDAVPEGEKELDALVQMWALRMKKLGEIGRSVVLMSIR